MGNSARYPRDSIRANWSAIPDVLPAILEWGSDNPDQRLLMAEWCDDNELTVQASRIRWWNLHAAPTCVIDIPRVKYSNYAIEKVFLRCEWIGRLGAVLVENLARVQAPRDFSRSTSVAEAVHFITRIAEGHAYGLISDLDLTTAWLDVQTQVSPTEWRADICARGLWHPVRGYTWGGIWLSEKKQVTGIFKNLLQLLEAEPPDSKTS